MFVISTCLYLPEKHETTNSNHLFSQFLYFEARIFFCHDTEAKSNPANFSITPRNEYNKSSFASKSTRVVHISPPIQLLFVLTNTTLGQINQQCSAYFCEEMAGTVRNGVISIPARTSSTNGTTNDVFIHHHHAC